MSEQDTVVFRRSRWRSLPFLAVSAAITWVFAEMAVLAAGAGAGGAIALVIFVAPCLCLLVLATVFWAREVLAPHGRVWIAEDGVGQVGAFQTLVVPWSQIAEIAVTGPALGAKYVSITVRDARCFGAQDGPGARVAAVAPAAWPAVARVAGRDDVARQRAVWGQGRL